MLKNHFKIAWRSLLKNKGYTGINIMGLTIGLTCSLLIALYIQDELSFDRYHAQVNQIYRVIHGHSDRANLDASGYQFSVWGNAPVGAALKADYPEVQNVVQFSGRTTILMKYGDKAFQEENVFFADSGAFQMFSWPLLAGDLNTALQAPYSAVISESTAKKYFGTENPIGKTLEGGNTGGRAATGTYTITAVMKDIPANSHFTFDVLLSMSSFRKSWSEVFSQWGYVDFYTYFLTTPQFNANDFSKQIPDFLTRHKASPQGHYTLAIEPLKDAYLHSTASRQPGSIGSLSNLYIFSVIGFFILCIACVNFMNLSTARSMERAKEVGIRKVAGADRQELIVQFFSESLLIVLISAVLAFVFTILLFPTVRILTGKVFAIHNLFAWDSMLIYIAVVLVTGILAGGYPAIILSGFKPMTVLRGSFRTSAQGSRLRQGLVILQFSLSIALMIGTAVVFSQLDYMQTKQMGFQKEQMLVIDFNHDQVVTEHLNTIKNTFREQPEVLSVAASRSIPGSFFPNGGTVIESSSGTMTSFVPAIFEVDADFINHFGLEMAAGRAYSTNFPADTAFSLIINEAAAKEYGYTDPEKIIGKKFHQWGRTGQVIGVVKDFNYLSLHDKVEPLALRYEPASSRYLSLRLKSGNLRETIAKIEKQWAALAPHRPFIYTFLDESFNRQYEADVRFRALFAIFSGLAILIACLGLLGLATYTAQQRSKEIGIRKVLGASVTQITTLLSKDFIKLVLIAILIASPISWWVMNKWLQDFAYKIDIQWWMFALAGFASVFIAVLTVSTQAIKAAVANPVKSLRAE